MATIIQASNRVHVECKLGATLRRYRKERSETLKQVADATGLSISFLSELERDDVDPSLATLRTLCRHYSRTLWLDFVLNRQEAA